MRILRRAPNLSCLAYASGFSLWHFRTAAETLDQVAAPGFFDLAADMLVEGDMIVVNAVDGSRIVVVARGAAGVTVVPLG